MLHNNKLGIVGDCHHGMKGGSHIMRDWQKNHLISYIIPYFKSQGITELFSLGDWFDTRRYVLASDMYWMVNELLPLLQKNEMTLHMIIGNHEIALLDSVEINHCQRLEQESLAYGHCVKAYPDPTELSFSGLDILVLPWICSENKSHVEQAIVDSQAKVVLAHLELESFLISPNKLATKGTISTSLFEKFELCLTGHYHLENSKILRSGTEIKYVGVPYHQSWPDYYHTSENGVYELDCTTRQYKLIPNKKDQSIFMELEYNYKDIASKKIGKKWLDVEFLENILHLKNKVLKVIIADRSNAKHYSSFVKTLRSVECVNYNIIDTTKSIELEAEEVNANDFKVSPIEILLNKINDIEYTNYEDNKEIRYEAIGKKLQSVYDKCQDENNLV